jgi:PKD repeat protein
MKNYFTIFGLLFFLLPLRSWSQGDHFECGATIMREKLIKQHPEILQQEQALEDFTRDFVEKYQREHNGTEKTTQGHLILPIVFHIISQGGAENISDAQVEDEVRIMNRDYNKQNVDTADAVSDFGHIIGDMNIEFRLANIDPNGNCTNGIDRVNSDQTWWADDYSKLNNWDRNKYLNVWVVNYITGGAAGYAYYPGSVANVFSTPAMDGVIILDNFTGSIGTSTPYTSRVLTHEIGHCFNLEHCWGNTNQAGVICGDDGVGDTPFTKGFSGCPLNNLALQEACTPGVIENYQNFMEYSFCSIMFTNGQVARAMAALNSSIASRNNLYTDSNLIATGTYDTANRTRCAPIANFNVSNRYFCAGGTTNFLNITGNATATNTDQVNYLWSFPTGTPNTSTQENPTVTFNTVGWQTVTLTATNNEGSSTKSDTQLVYVSAHQAQHLAPYFEGFEDPNIFNENEWVSVNYDAGNAYDNNITWFTQVNYGAHSGNGAAMLNNYYAHANRDIDEIISPGIDLTHLTSNQLNLSFYYSLASNNTDFVGLPDSMVVYASDNCGQNWQMLYTSGSRTNIANAGYYNGFYIPQNSDLEYWKKVSISIPGTFASSHYVIFKFREFTAVNGNNLFIDDINIGDSAVAAAITETSGDINSLALYPNPGNGIAILSLALARDEKVIVKLYDVTGKEVLDAFEGSMNEGANQIDINGSALAAGIYVVSIKAGDAIVQKKLVIK